MLPALPGCPAGRTGLKVRRRRNHRNAWTLLATLGVFAGLLVPVSLPAAAAAAPAASPVHPVVAGVTKPQADVPAPKPAADGEVTAWRTATSDTFVDPKVPGAYETKFSATPINYKDSSGSMVPIDTTLQANANGWSPKASPVALQLPSSLGSGPITVGGGSSQVSLRMQGAAASPGTTAGSAVTYKNAYPGVTIRETATSGGVKESLSLGSANATNSFDTSVGLPAGARLSASPDGALLVQAGGKTVATLAAPAVADAAGASSTKAASYSVSGNTVTLSLAPAWLNDSSRKFPVTIDPSTAIGTPSRAYTYIESGTNATTNYSTSSVMCAGVDAAHSSDIARSLISFQDIGAAMPRDAEILEAKFGLTLTSTSANMTVNAYPLTTSYNYSAATWNKATSSTNWTSAGGDYDSSIVSTPMSLTSGQTGGTQDYINPKIVTEWLNGNEPQDGFLLRSSNESGSGFACFTSLWGTGSSPWFTVDWQYRTGLRSDQTYVSHRVDTHEAVNVNVANGNMVDEATEFADNSPGVPLSIDRTYNSDQASDPWSNGLGWFNTPQDTGVYGNYAAYVAALYDGSFLVSSGLNGDDAFSPWHPSDYSNINNGAFTEPPATNASLTNSSGNHSGDFTLTHNQSQITELSPQSADTQLSKLTDRSGNSETINRGTNTFPPYGYPDVSTVTTTSNRTYTFTSPTNGYITGITGPTVNAAQATAYTYSGGSTYSSTPGTGELQTATDASGGVTHYGYDSSERLVGITSPAGRDITFSYNANSQIAAMTYVTNAASCNISAPTAATCPGDTYAFAYTQPSSTGATCTRSTRTGCGITVVTDPNSNQTTYDWNSSDEIVKTIDALGHAHSGDFNPNGDQVSLADNSNDLTSLGYSSDGLNNPTSVSLPTGAQSTLSFPSSPTPNGQGVYPGTDYEPTTSTDGQGHQSSYSYNTNGLLATITAPGSKITSYGYQGDSGVTGCNGLTGQICTATTPAGNTTTYTYSTSGNGDLIQVTPPSPLGTSTYTYDAWGRTATTTDGDNHTTTAFYNGLDEVTELRYDGGSSATCSTSDANAGKCIGYTYDPDGNLYTRQDATGTTTYITDSTGNLYQETLPGSVTSSVTYDADGNILTYTDPGGTVTYHYDPANRLWDLAEPGGTCPSYPTVPTYPSTLCTGFTFNNNGLETAVEYPSGETNSNGYDTSGRQTSLQTTTPTLGTIVNRTYSYTKTGSDTMLLQSAVDSVAGTTTTYGYDGLNRLTSASGGPGGNYTYSYDADSNRTKQTVGSSSTYYHYNAADQLCWSGSTNGSSCTTTPSGDTSYTFDGAGNQTAAGTTSSSYNSKNQTTAIGSTNFAYTGAGQSQRTTAGSTSYSNNLLGLTQTSGGSSIYFTRTPDGQLISMRQGAGSGSTNSYYTTDDMGSVINLVNAAGTSTVASYSYDPYGTSLSATGTLASTNPYRYATGYYDAASGLLKLGERYYNPALGRFTQVDPTHQEANAYAYASCNPASFDDPNGTDSCIIDGLISSAPGDIMSGIEGFFEGGPAGAVINAINSALLGVVKECGKADLVALVRGTLGNAAADFVSSAVSAVFAVQDLQDLSDFNSFLDDLANDVT